MVVNNQTLHKLASKLQHPGSFCVRNLWTISLFILQQDNATVAAFWLPALAPVRDLKFLGI